jgi:hypothetical protein
MVSLLTPPPKVSTPMLLDTPWARVKHPTPLPADFSAADFMELSDVEFAQLLRDNLAPRQPIGAVREAWGKFWVTLGSSEPELADRVFDVLEEFFEQTEEALGGGQLDDAQTKRARKFLRFCEEAWNRLEVIVDQPLGWAGRAANGFNPKGRLVIAQLVDAITTHRDSVARVGDTESANEALWAVLRKVRLDPAMSRTGADSG